MDAMQYDLRRTRDAIAAYDEADARFRDPALWENGGPSTGEASRLLAELEQLGEAVGIAYGEDTKDINDPDTCRQCVRPGPATPPLGETRPSFVRRMVADWENSLHPADPEV
jgi:hypothetical protein